MPFSVRRRLHGDVQRADLKMLAGSQTSIQYCRGPTRSQPRGNWIKRMLLPLQTTGCPSFWCLWIQTWQWANQLKVLLWITRVSTHHTNEEARLASFKRRFQKHGQLWCWFGRFWYWYTWQIIDARLGGCSVEHSTIITCNNNASHNPAVGKLRVRVSKRCYTKSALQSGWEEGNQRSSLGMSIGLEMTCHWCALNSLLRRPLLWRMRWFWHGVR